MSEAEANLRNAIEQGYAAFAGVPRPHELHSSPLRNADEILRTLASAPLRELTAEQIGPYAGWAITTVGDERDYRHFLPRIFELAVTDSTWLGAEPPIMASRLNMASWRTWSDGQKSAVLPFFRAAMNAVMERHPDEGQSADNWFCGIVTLGEPAAPILERWRSSASANAALHMASFIISEAKYLNRHGEVRGAFWKDVKEEARREVAKLLLAKTTKDFLKAAAGKVSEQDRSYFVDGAFAELQRQS